MMKLKLNLHWKLSIVFLAITIAIILFVNYFARMSIAQHFQSFCETYGAQLPRCLYGQGGQMFLGAITNSLTLVAIVGIVLAFILGYVFSLYFLKPIETIIKSSKKVASGDYKERINLKTNDEIDGLIESLNEMFSSLEKIETLRRDLVANISHELSTPLTNVYGYLEALADNVITGEKDREKTIILIKEETERLIQLVRELKELTLLESDNFTLVCKTTDINRLLEKTLNTFQPRIKAKNISINRHFEEELISKVDANKFQQAISNLLDNAIKYSKDKGIIEIQTGKDEEGIFISIKDHGVGINTEDLPFIFERFYQSDKSRTKDHEGSGIGIGLTIVKKIIEAHKGKIEVKSKYGKGSEFMIYLPS